MGNAFDSADPDASSGLDSVAFAAAPFAATGSTPPAATGSRDRAASPAINSVSSTPRSRKSRSGLSSSRLPTPDSTAAACLHSVCCVPAFTRRHDLSGLREHPAVAMGDDLGDVLRQPPPGATRAANRSGRRTPWRWPSRRLCRGAVCGARPGTAPSRSPSRRPGQARLTGDTHCRCASTPCRAPAEPRIRRTTRRARTNAGPRSCWRPCVPATPPVATVRRGRADGLSPRRSVPVARRRARSVDTSALCRTLLFPFARFHTRGTLPPPDTKVNAPHADQRNPLYVSSSRIYLLKRGVQPRLASPESALGRASVRRRPELRTVRASR